MSFFIDGKIFQGISQINIFFNIVELRNNNKIYYIIKANHPLPFRKQLIKNSENNGMRYNNSQSIL